MINWVLGLYFLSFFLFFFVVLLVRSPIRKFFGRQVEKYINLGKEKAEEPVTLRQLMMKFIDLITPVIGKISFTVRIQSLIEKSGIPLRASELIFFHGIGLFSSILFGYFVAGPIGAVLMFTIAMFLPYLGLKRIEKKRQDRFHEQLPDSLSLISGALKAGYSFLQAVDMTVRETSPPTSVEFKRVLTETRLGLPLEQALDSMARRLESDSFDWTVMAVKTQREVGGNLAEILEIVSNTIRERDQVARQIKVLTAEGRLSAIILFLLPFVVGILLWVINPGYLGLLFTHPMGIGMLLLAIVMLAMGGLWLKKVVTVEV